MDLFRKKMPHTAGEVDKNRLPRHIAIIMDGNDAQQSKDEAKQKHIQELYDYWNYYYNIRSVTLYDFINDQTLDAEFEKIVRR